MAINDFMTLNLPYGMRRIEGNKWVVFNREYKPLGNNYNCGLTLEEYKTLPNDTAFINEYPDLTDKLILSDIALRDDSLVFDDEGKIYQFFLHKGVTNTSEWNEYSKRLANLIKVKVQL